MSKFPILYWPYKTNGNSDYQLARKVINGATGIMPEVISEDLNLAAIFETNQDAVVYYPVFCESCGWWGELLGGDGVIVEKLIISPECQLMVIVAETHAKAHGIHHLLAAEIRPASGFFKKMNLVRINLLRDKINLPVQICKLNSFFLPLNILL